MEFFVDKEWEKNSQEGRNGEGGDKVGFLIFPYFRSGPTQVKMNGVIRTIAGAGTTHFAKLVACQRNRKKFHRTTPLFSVTFVTISGSALRAADIIVGSQFYRGKTGKQAAEIAHRTNIATPDLRLKNKIDRNS